MNKVKILADSCADLTAAQLEKYDIDYVRMTNHCNGVETPAITTWSKEEVFQFYGRIKSGERITTSQVSVEEFKSVFTKYLDEGYDIVYIGCSSKQSGSVNTAAIVAKNLHEQYPDRTIISIDSLNGSIGEGMLAIEASKMAAEGATAKEIEEKIIAIRKNVVQYVTVASLEYMRRAGRVKASKAFLGNLMGVKPILIADANGAQVAYKKAKGRAGSLNTIVSLMKENIVNPEEQTIYLWHSACSDKEVEELVALIKSEIPCKDVEVGYIGPIIGACLGPESVGIWAMGKTVTFAMTE